MRQEPRNLTNEDLDRLGRRLMQAADSAPRPSVLSDAAFVAGFRTKLAAERLRQENLVDGIGAWGWKLGPMLVPATAALAVLLFFMPTSGLTSEPDADNTQTVLLATMTEQEPADLTGEAVLDAILLAERR